MDIEKIEKDFVEFVINFHIHNAKEQQCVLDLWQQVKKKLTIPSEERREKLLKLKVDTTEVLRGNTEPRYLTEHDVSQIEALFDKPVLSKKEIAGIVEPLHAGKHYPWNSEEHKAIAQAQRDK